MALIAPFVRAWNLFDMDEQPIPPPSEAGADVLAELDLVIETWLRDAIVHGYRLGKGVRHSGKKSGELPEPTSGPQIAPDAASE